MQTTYNIIYLAGLVCITAIRMRYSGGRPKNIILDHDTTIDKLLQFLSGLAFTIIPLLYIFTPWLAFADLHYANDLLLILGICGTGILIVALWVAWRAQHDLGNNWTAALHIKSGHELITHGIYRTWRHPMYAANMLWGLAQLLLLPNWLAGPAMLVTFVPFYLVRVRREEQMLLEHFGEPYRLYCKHSGRLWPRHG